jgi:hypothetical protein
MVGWLVLDERDDLGGVDAELLLDDGGDGGALGPRRDRVADDGAAEVFVARGVAAFAVDEPTVKNIRSYKKSQALLRPTTPTMH